MRLIGYLDHGSTSLQITVSYDERENEVLSVLSVIYADKSGSTHDLTNLFTHQMNDEIELTIKRIDWREISRKAA